VTACGLVAAEAGPLNKNTYQRANFRPTPSCYCNRLGGVEK
jgi:hypothetical protein